VYRIAKPRGKRPHILFFDIETSPLLIWAWGTREVDAIRVKREWHILCFAYKWQGGRAHFIREKQYRGDDRNVVRALWELFSLADVIVAHNLSRFDRRRANARFSHHGLTPPKPYMEVDTLRIARREFAFTSNRLDELGEYLGVGRKEKHDGIDTWLDFMGERGAAAQRRARAQMRRYNIRDVELLEKVYRKLLPWARGTPNMGLWRKGEYACPACGSINVRKNGVRHTNTGVRQELLCNDCGRHARVRKQETTTEKVMLV